MVVWLPLVAVLRRCGVTVELQCGHVFCEDCLSGVMNTIKAAMVKVQRRGGRLTQRRHVTQRQH